MPTMVHEGGKGAAKFPEKAYTKHIPHVEGAGSETDYPDMEPAIRRNQEKGISKAKGHKMKEGYRY